MSIEKAFRTSLAANVPQAVDGVYYRAVPQRQPITQGMVIIRPVVERPTYALDGSVKYAEVSMQVDCWGRTWDDVAAVVGGIRGAIEAYTGLMGTIHVHAVFLEGMRDLDDPELPDFRRRVLDLAIWYREA